MNPLKTSMLLNKIHSVKKEDHLFKRAPWNLQIERDRDCEEKKQIYILFANFINCYFVGACWVNSLVLLSLNKIKCCINTLWRSLYVVNRLSDLVFMQIKCCYMFGTNQSYWLNQFFTNSIFCILLSQRCLKRW